MICTLCDGGGVVEAPCPDCEDGKPDCSACDNTRVSECEECGGRGSLDCILCFNSKGGKECGKCGGKGVRNCPECEGAKEVVCYDCGDHEDPCPTCKGTVRVEVACDGGWFEAA